MFVLPTLAVVVAAALATFTALSIEPAHATIEKDDAASSLAPGKEAPHCIGCAEQSGEGSGGIVGLDEPKGEIIGPEIGDEQGAPASIPSNATTPASNQTINATMN
jgi:hypothetical protein